MIRTWVFLGVLGASVIACGDGSGTTDSTRRGWLVGLVGRVWRVWRVWLVWLVWRRQRGSERRDPDDLGHRRRPLRAGPGVQPRPVLDHGEAQVAAHAPGHGLSDLPRGDGAAGGEPLPIVGTVYATGHEPDDCLGVDGGVKPILVEVTTTADARVVKLPVDGSGNFLYDIFEDGGALHAPRITARVVQGDKERKMSGSRRPATATAPRPDRQRGRSGTHRRAVRPGGRPSAATHEVRP